jgi:hypothetical protein
MTFISNRYLYLVQKTTKTPEFKGFPLYQTCCFFTGGGEPYTIVATISREDLLENYR